MVLGAVLGSGCGVLPDYAFAPAAEAQGGRWERDRVSVLTALSIGGKEDRTRHGERNGREVFERGWSRLRTGVETRVIDLGQYAGAVGTATGGRRFMYGCPSAWIDMLMLCAELR